MMVEHRSVLTERKDSETVHHSFGVADSRGRAIGSQISTETRTFAKAPGNQEFGAYIIEPGTYFVWQPWVTRNNEPYGAVQGGRVCKTIQERDIQIAKYLEAAKKRAFK